MKRMLQIMSYSILAAGLTLPGVVLAQTTLNNPLTGGAWSLPVSAVVGRVIRAILGMSGVVAAIVIIVAGLRVIFSQGNEDAISQGKQAIIWATIGLVVAFGGYMIVGLIIQQGSTFLGGQ